MRNPNLYHGFIMKPISTHSAKLLICKKPVWVMIGLWLGMASQLQAQSWTNAKLSAGQRAASLVNAMTFSEMSILVAGGGGSYVGNIPKNTRLGIPALNLQDGPAGIGDGVNNVTAFPAPITIPASFSTHHAAELPRKTRVPARCDRNRRRKSGDVIDPIADSRRTVLQIKRRDAQSRVFRNITNVRTAPARNQDGHLAESHGVDQRGCALAGRKRCIRPRLGLELSCH